MFSGNASAQYRSFVLGIKAAPHIGWLNTNQKDYNSEGTKLGFSWGVTSEFYFAKNYALATGLNFIYQNGALSFPDIIGGNLVTLQRDYRIRYLELPAVLKMKTNEIGDFRYFGQIGLGFAVRTSSKGQDEYKTGTSTVVEEYRDIDDHTNLFRTSMIVGAGVEYPFDNNTSIVAAINYNNGFTNALRKKNTVNFHEHQGKPNFIELSLGVIF
jgi:opacity protein-like surface antigen